MTEGDRTVVVNESGKNLSPTNIEMAIQETSPLIDQVVAIGDARSYVTALIVLDSEAAAALGMADPSAAAFAQRREAGELLAAAVREGTKLSRVEQIKRFVIVGTPWGPGRRGAHPDDETQTRADRREACRRRSTSSTPRRPGRTSSTCPIATEPRRLDEYHRARTRISGDQPVTAGQRRSIWGGLSCSHVGALGPLYAVAMKRLSSLDAAFWFADTHECPMHIGGLTICDPSKVPNFTFGAVKDLLAAVFQSCQCCATG